MTRFLCRSVLAIMAMAAPVRAEQKVLRVVPQNDIVLLDPVFGTALVSMISGLMIYESLFAWDSAMRPQPQMVASWSSTPDGLVWRFTLRDGLRFHDGQAVTTADVVTSLRRWMAGGGDGRDAGDRCQDVRNQAASAVPRHAARAGGGTCTVRRHHEGAGHSAGAQAGDNGDRLRSVPVCGE
jgi:ABC-type transport system substrate-binding protein